MEIDLVEINGRAIAEVRSQDIVIKELQDALDLMADCTYNGCSSMIIHENNIVPEFFDLKSGMAGEVLQKFSTYNVRLAIIGDFSKYSSRSLRDFIFESNKYGHICFTDSLDEARKVLSKK